MRIRAARRTAPACRGQWNGVRVERADGENARRQPERNHSMREHGSHWQQPRMRWLTLLPDTVTLAFRNPAMETSIHEQQTHSMSRRTHRHDQRQRQVRRQWTAELLDGE